MKTVCIILLSLLAFANCWPEGLQNRYKKRAVVSALSAAAISNAARGFASQLGQKGQLSRPVSQSFEDACLGNSWPTGFGGISSGIFSGISSGIAGGIAGGFPISQISAGISSIGKRADDDRLANRDIVFVLDTSGSIPQDQFDKAKKAINVLVESFCPSAFGNEVTDEGSKQISVVLFDSTVTTEVDFSDSSRGFGYLQDKILDMKHRRGGTATGDALTYVKTKVLGKGSSRLNDPEVSTDVIVITDGQCNQNCRVLGSEAQAIRKMGHGVNVFAMGVANARACELEIITGTGNDIAYGLGDFRNFDRFATSVKEIAQENASKCA